MISDGMRRIQARRGQLKRRIQEHLKDLLKEASHLRPGEDEGRTAKAIHKTRVLSRRLEALAGLWGPDKDETFDKALKRYKKVRKALGEIREHDVHRAQWAEWAAGRRYFGVVDKEILRKREKALDRFLTDFEWSGLKKAVRKLGKAVEEAQAGTPASTAEGKRLLQELAAKIFSDREIHDVRLDLKKLRYTLEGLEALAGGRKTKAANRNLVFLKELQAELGRINDLETMTRFLRKLRKKRADRWDHATGAAVEKTADELDARLLEERHRWDKLWPERRKKLKEITS